MRFIQGPREPAWCRQARNQYWQHTLTLRALEDKLAHTEQGYAFVLRVRQAGTPSMSKAA